MDDGDGTTGTGDGGGWATAGIGLLVALFVIAALATVHSIWFTLLR